MSDETTPDPMDPQLMASLKHWGDLPENTESEPMHGAGVVDCGWGRLIFGQTFEDPNHLVHILLEEKEGCRDVALYVRDPHVLISLAPQELFLDPSHTYRLALLENHGLPLTPSEGFEVIPLENVDQGKEANQILAKRGMIRVGGDYYRACIANGHPHILIAKDSRSGQVLAVATGIDHRRAINDPDNGSSLWSLAVDPHCPYPGVGQRMVLAMAAKFRDDGRAFMDLSVIHNNVQAIALYEKLGFEKVPVYCLKHKNCINETLFSGPLPEQGLNIYARIIVNEARRRGILVEVLEAETGYFNLSFGGRSVTCRESLAELTSAIAMSRCQDKAVTNRILKNASLAVPDQITAGDDQAVVDFLKRHGRVVVKPVSGEQGHGVRVDLRTPQEVSQAINQISSPPNEVLLEELVPGEDLRIIVIDGAVVAAAVRKPPQVTGDGKHTIHDLIEKQSRRQAAATDGESRIPLDGETVRCVGQSGFNMNAVLPSGITIMVRKTANLHTGGTIHDVTPILHPELAKAAVIGSQALDIPVVGLDFMVPSVGGPKYRIIEANERPGLANHEPQPTAERFIDLLFPQTKPAGVTCQGLPS